MERKKLIQDTHVRAFWMTILFLFIVAIIQSIGSFLVDSSIDVWYMQLKKPSWTPPPPVFGPVWFILYIFIAFVGFTIWTRDKSKDRTLAFSFWILQLFFNGIWTYFFFGLQSPTTAFVDLLLALLFTVLTMVYGYRLHKAIFYFFIPYVLWLIYASAINLAIVIMN